MEGKKNSPINDYRHVNGLQTEEKEYLDRIAEDQKIMERLTNKRGLLIKKREECMRKIRELGSLPADTSTKYQNLSLKEVSCNVCNYHYVMYVVTCNNYNDNVM